LQAGVLHLLIRRSCDAIFRQIYWRTHAEGLACSMSFLAAWDDRSVANEREQAGDEDDIGAYPE
jgi:hypothetical protein